MTTIHVKTRYLDDDATITFGEYANGDTAITLTSTYGEPLATATVNLEDYGRHPQPGHIFIKNWSENEGILTALQNAGIIGDVTETIPLGYVQAVEVPLLIEPQTA